MKIDRVILSCNYNRLYSDFWNPLSKLYNENFGIKPTLIFLGSEEELLESNLSNEYGEIIRIDFLKNMDVWACTWALFYHTKFYPDDVCLIMGIDQIPLGTLFIRDIIEKYEDDKYLMLIDDAYKITSNIKKWDEGGYSPSAYHIAKGSLFNKIYEFEDNFEREIEKVESLKLINLFNMGLWGLDETYSSKILREKKSDYPIIGLSRFSDLLNGRRIDCYRSHEVYYDLEKLKNNFYIECHSCRPYNNHKDYINNIIKNVNKY